LAATSVEARPRYVRVIRHRHGIPQYTRGHLGRLALIDAALGRRPGLFLAGNAYRGVAVNDCVRQAVPLAETILAYLRAVQARSPIVSATPAAPSLLPHSGSSDERPADLPVA
jgi:hypothetical protein